MERALWIEVRLVKCTWIIGNRTMVANNLVLIKEGLVGSICAEKVKKPELIRLASWLSESNCWSAS